MDKKNFFLVHDGHSADELPFIELKSYHWEAPVPYRPRTFAKMFVLNNELSARLICYESSPKAVYNSRDERIWCDSCLEFFVAPLSSRSEYINIETNSRGAYLSQFGASRDGRVFLKTLTDIAPDVKSFKGEDESGGRNRDSVTSDALEALIGAIFLDGGFDKAKEFVLKFVLNDIENKMNKLKKKFINLFRKYNREEINKYIEMKDQF